MVILDYRQIMLKHICNVHVNSHADSGDTGADYIYTEEYIHICCGLCQPHLHMCSAHEASAVRDYAHEELPTDLIYSSHMPCTHMQCEIHASAPRFVMYSGYSLYIASHIHVCMSG